MEDLLSEIAADAAAEAVALPSDEKIKSITEMIARMKEIESIVSWMSEDIAALNAEWKKLNTESIPDALIAANARMIELTDGSKVEVIGKVHASISEDNQAAAHAWLRENGFDDLIKNVFKVPFGKGEEEEAAALAKALVDAEMTFERKESVNSQTLGAFVREQMAKEKDGRGRFTAPREVFGIFEENVTKITPPKKKKK